MNKLESNLRKKLKKYFPHNSLTVENKYSHAPDINIGNHRIELKIYENMKFSNGQIIEFNKSEFNTVLVQVKKTNKYYFITKYSDLLKINIHKPMLFQLCIPISFEYVLKLLRQDRPITNASIKKELKWHF